jgi:hypothetical protein
MTIAAGFVLAATIVTSRQLSAEWVNRDLIWRRNDEAGNDGFRMTDQDLGTRSR